MKDPNSPLDPIVKKKCPCCKKKKPLSDFYKDASRKDGVTTVCKNCHSISVKRWQEKNADKCKEINKAWKMAHKKQLAEQARARARLHPDSRRRRYREHRQQNSEQDKRWRANNKEKIRQYAQNRRARVHGNGGEITPAQWESVLDFFGHKCLCCGKENVKLTMDHVIPVALGGSHTVDNIQPLCGPCNSGKKDKYIDYRKEAYAPTRD